MWKSLKALFTERPSAPADAGVTLELAIATLLVRASVIDNNPTPEETRTIKALLAGYFNLSPEAAVNLLDQARKEEVRAVDLYRFTSIVTAQLDNEQRQRIIEMIWEVVLADGRIDAYEDNLVWRVAELLGVSTRDRIRLKQAVESRHDA